MRSPTLACATVTLFFAILSAPAYAQGARKVFICADIEGISGVTGSEQASNTGAEYSRGRKLMADDVNAAIRGAVAGGATDIVVIDSHGTGYNIQRDDLDTHARLMSGNSIRRYGMMEGLDDTFDAVFFIGHHAKAGSPTGVLAHTQNANIRDVQINGRSVGEGGINTFYTHWFGVPVVLVTGDQIAVAQIKEVATEASAVVVKRALAGGTVELRPTEETRDEIQRTAEQAVRAARRLEPRRTGPFRVQIWYRDSAIPEVVEAIPGLERPTPDSVALTADSMPAAFALYRVLYRHIDAR